jgi:hypothetical protein
VGVFGILSVFAAGFAAVLAEGAFAIRHLPAGAPKNHTGFRASYRYGKRL